MAQRDWTSHYELKTTRMSFLLPWLSKKLPETLLGLRWPHWMRMEPHCLGWRFGTLLIGDQRWHPAGWVHRIFPGCRRHPEAHPLHGHPLHGHPLHGHPLHGHPESQLQHRHPETEFPWCLGHPKNVPWTRW